MKTAVLLLSLLPMAALAKEPFEGHWKARVDSFKSTGAPDVYELKDGMFNCKSCAPPYSIKADGTMQKTTENPYRDHASVKITGSSSVEWTVQKDGKTLSTVELSTSADGQTLTTKATNYGGTSPTNATVTEKRSAAGAPGSHPISGSWQNPTVSSAGDNALMFVYTATPNGLKSESNGVTVDAKFDGKAYPAVGDPGHTMVTLKRVSDHEIEETDRQGDKVSDVVQWKLSADGKTITFVDVDKLHNTTTSFTADRQN